MALTNRLLEYTGSRAFARRPTELSDLLARLRPRIDAMVTPSITADWQVPVSGIVLNADRSQIEFVVTELASNAVHALDGAGSISMRAWTDELRQPLETPIRTVAPGRYAVIEVADTGRGIAPPDIRRIFDPFFSTQPFHASRGLGLSAVHGILGAHGGGLAVDSTQGHGTRMRVYLPLGASQPVLTA